MLKNTIKLFLIFVIFIFSFQGAEAKKLFNPISSAINDANISKHALISVSFKEVQTAKKFFEINAQKPMTPASIQKITTYLPAVDVLGKNYEFKTELYQDKTGKLYLKLSGNPYFTSKDLKTLLSILPAKKITTTSNFFIDDFILDEFEWGEGWQWDDDLNSRMPKFSAYNIDGNLFKVTFLPTTPNAPAQIVQDVFYPTSYINQVLTGNSNSIMLSRKNYISPDVINADGVIAKEVEFSIPVNSPRRYFLLRIEEILRNQKFDYYGNYLRAKIPKDAKLLAVSKTSSTMISSSILKQSNNMIAETFFKLAGGKFTQTTGTIEGAIEMFHKYYNDRGISTENIKIVDGSGVSKNNLLTADFITTVLIDEMKNPDFENFKSSLAVPNEGTLTDRMLYFKDKLYAKTGTLANVSSIAGYLTAKSNKTYAFCIMINDASTNPADLKSFEEYVLRKAYDKL